MAFKKRPSDGLSFGKQLTGYMFISIVFVALQLSSSYSAQLLDEYDDDNQTNQISSIEATVPADNATIINPITPVSSNQMSSSPSSESPNTTTPTSTTTEATTTTTTSTTLPPPLPTPLPSKGHPKLYSDSQRSLYLAMDNLLQSKASYLGRTKRMKRSRPNMIKSDSSSGNSFSLIKYLLTNHLPSSNDYPMSYSLTNTKSGQFGPVYSSNGNFEDSLDRNDFSSSSMMNKIHSRINPEQLASFYPLTTNDIEAIEFGGEGDDTFDSGFNGEDDWNNQGTIDLLNQLETDGNNNNNNNIDIYSMDPFIPLRSFRSIPKRPQSGLLMRPIISMKRKTRPINNGIEKSPNSIILSSSLFGGDNRYRSRANTNQYEQLINRIKDNPTAYL